jgi:hypothetical protein
MPSTVDIAQHDRAKPRRGGLDDRVPDCHAFRAHGLDLIDQDDAVARDHSEQR